MYGETVHDIRQAAAAPEKTYVSFGPRDTQEIPIEWAEKMLTAWFAAHPAQFSKALSQAATSEP